MEQPRWKHTFFSSVMRTLLFFFIIIGCIVLIPSIRRFFFHVHVRRFLYIMLMTTLVFLFLGILFFAYWYRKTYVLPALPKTSWSDTTLEQEMNPETPQKGGRTITPTIVR